MSYLDKSESDILLACLQRLVKEVNSEYVGLYKPSANVHGTSFELPQIKIPGPDLLKPPIPYPHIVIMDALKAEIALKRKSVETVVGSRPTKYMRRGDIERIKQEEEQKAKQERARAVQDEAQNRAEVDATEQGKPEVSVTIFLVLY